MRIQCSWLVAPALLAALACAPREPAVGPGAGPPSPRSRGVILISIDALRADALGLGDRPAPPFLARLTESGVRFDHAFSPIPATLPAHLTMLTGLHPTRHGVAPPSDVLSDEIPTLAERLAADGVRTFGHSEGGFMEGGYGFARGFEEWTDEDYAADTDVERTLGAGLDSLARVGDGERFFLFLHSYTVHDPYDPPPGWRGRLGGDRRPEGAFPPTGSDLAAFNRGERELVPGAVEWYRALYDEGVLYLDSVLGRFFDRLGELGLAEETTVVLTSDHGEEFLEHGRLVHHQIYPECLRVPLVITLPGADAGRRSRRVAGLVDLTPTVLELLGVPVPEGLDGRSLAGELVRPAREPEGRAFAQDEGTEVRGRTLLAPVAGRLHQLLRFAPAVEPDGVWVGREHRFDASGAALELRAAAFLRPRRVRILAGDRQLAELEIGTTWSGHRVELPAGVKHRLTLRSDSCDVPREVGRGDDGRCLSVKIAGVPLDRIELYDLERDPWAQSDLSADRPDLVRLLAAGLATYPETPVAHAPARPLDEQQIRHLKSLGYL